MLIAEELDTEGIDTAKVSHKTNNANIEFDETKISETKIKQLIKNQGFEVK